MNTLNENFETINYSGFEPTNFDMPDGFSRNRKAKLYDMYNCAGYRDSIGKPLKGDETYTYPSVDDKISDNVRRKWTKQNDEYITRSKLSPKLHNEDRKENRYEIINQKFEVREFDNKGTITNRNLDNFIDIIYNNFYNLTAYPVLKHNKEEISRLLKSPKLLLFTIFLHDKMIGYIVGEYVKLDDGRNVAYVSYLYVSSKFRGAGIGTILLNTLINKAMMAKVDDIVLISDTEDQKVLDFYFKKGFIYDLQLRRYDRYDILSLDLQNK